MRLDEVVAIFNSRELVADKMAILLDVDSKLREGLSLDIIVSDSPSEDTVWAIVYNNIVDKRMQSVQLRHIDYETFSEYYRNPKFSLVLSDDSDLIADTINEARRILGSMNWKFAELTIGDVGLRVEPSDTVLIRTGEGYSVYPAHAALLLITEYIDQGVAFSFDVNPQPSCSYKPD